MSKKILTHGAKFDFDPTGKPIGNPGMKPDGFEAIRALKPTIASIFPDGKPQRVVCATGQRHSDIADALEYDIDFFTAALGTADSLVVIGKDRKIVLANGRLVDYDKYATGVTPEAVKKIIRESPDNTLFCVGRPTILFGFGLSKEEARSGAIYDIDETGEEMKLILIADGVLLDSVSAEV